MLVKALGVRHLRTVSRVIPGPTTAATENRQGEADSLVDFSEGWERHRIRSEETVVDSPGDLLRFPDVDGLNEVRKGPAHQNGLDAIRGKFHPIFSDPCPVMGEPPVLGPDGRLQVPLEIVRVSAPAQI